MNLLTESRCRLNYYEKHLEDLQGLLSCTNKTHLSKDAIHYINDELVKARRNIKYYEEIIKALEE